MNASKQKGDRAERAILKRMRDAGIEARRTLTSGARNRGPTFDIELADGRRVEVKSRKTDAGFKFITQSLGDTDLLFVVVDRCEPLVVMRMGHWLVECRRPMPDDEDDGDDDDDSQYDSYAIEVIGQL